VLIVVGRVTVRPDAVDRALEVSLEHVHRSRTEPGCLFHSVHRGVEDPNTLFFFEQWESDAALTAHFAVPESLAFVTARSELATKPPTMDLYEATPTHM
jgi:quinol monooxygenase YgiN